jgi:hypothetical protein
LLVIQILQESSELAFLWNSNQTDSNQTDSNQTDSNEEHYLLKKIRKKYDLDLNGRAYCRSLKFITAREILSDNFEKLFNYQNRILVKPKDVNYGDIRKISSLKYSKVVEKKESITFDIATYLSKKKPKYVLEKDIRQINEINDWIQFDVEENWIELFLIAQRDKHIEDKKNFTFFLSYLHYDKSANIDLILQLLFISENSLLFSHLRVPKPGNQSLYFENFLQSLDNEFRRTIQNCALRKDYESKHTNKTFSSDERKKIEQKIKEKEEVQENIIKKQVELLMEFIKKQEWSLVTVESVITKLRELFQSQVFDKINLQQLCKEIEKYLSDMIQNTLFKNFLNNTNTIISDNFEAIKCYPISQEQLSLSDDKSDEIPEEKTRNVEFDKALYFRLRKDVDYSKIELAKKIYSDGRYLFHQNNFGKINDPSRHIFNHLIEDLNDSFRLLKEEELVEEFNIEQIEKHKVLIQDTKDLLIKLLKDILTPQINELSTEQTFYLSGIHQFNSSPRIFLQLLLSIYSTQNFIHELWCFPFLKSNVDLPQDCVISVIGAIAILLTEEQRVERCIQYHNEGDFDKLKKEFNNHGHENWNPNIYPERILLEIEQNFLVRPLQHEVIEQMLSPKQNENSCLQLNMGEGKTSVILPCLAATLSYQSHHLVRIVVLDSLLPTNYLDLSFKLGGILNRCVYRLPFQRDIKLSALKQEALIKTYERITDQRDIVITTPESILSFRLKFFEACFNENRNQSTLFTLIQMLDRNVRDIIDESDEILGVKKQLIYTMGSQMPISGNYLRWEIPQLIFKIMKDKISILLENERNNFEYSPNEHVLAFPHIRQLGKTSTIVHHVLIDHLFEYLSKYELLNCTELQQQLIREYWSNTVIHKSSQIWIVLNLFNETERQILILIRGILAFGILNSVLQKRYRVSYGVNSKSDRLMAVPFIAKDVASERTEFGHPDIAIFLTIFSYYFSGLSREQLKQVFDKIAFLQQPDEVYHTFVKEIPEDKMIDSLRQFQCINLQDHRQFQNEIYPFFQFNIVIIN